MNLEVEECEGELRWLRWFYTNADFGPADGDVRYALKAAYQEEGHDLPDVYDQCESCGCIPSECGCK